ncbi:hypothetical protein [Streptomyces sp. NPDC056361]|uniref:hypothetical protein n=1 Tax=Streptomyces sp. NPDC056361 TaxID=3345795 RepID=UPI0035E3B666
MALISLRSAWSLLVRSVFRPAWDGAHWVLDVRRFQWILLFDCILFAVTGLIDLGLAGTPQVITCLLRLASAFVNAMAFMQIRKKLGRLRSAGVTTAGYKVWEFPSVIAGQASAIPILLFPIWIELGSGLHDIIDIIVFSGALLLIMLAVLAVVSVAGEVHALNATWGLVVAVLPLIGLIQFWYATFYRPAHEGPRVNVVAKLDEIGSHGGITRMRGTVILENVGAG